MGKKHLNKSARFKCGNGNAVWFSPQNGDFKVKINGAEALLTDCRLSLIGTPRPGQCNLVPDPTTGAPGMCTAAIISGFWSNNSRIKIAGKGVLNSGCSISCPVGGSITPFKPTIMAINVDDASKTQKADIGEFRNEDDANSSSNQGASSDYDKNTDDEADKVISSDVEAENSESVLNEQTQEGSEETEDIREVEYALCDYKNCSKANECEYLKAAHTLKETNESKNATVLRNNMGKDAFDLYAGDCSAIGTSLYGNYMYSIAHHHIVPANQCFKTFAEIVKLANYYGYDINKAENGICLPTMNEGYDKQPLALRKKIAFHAMETLGRQWHKGTHQYSCEKISEKIDKCLDDGFKDYRTSVNDLLAIFREVLISDTRCRTDNYEQQATEFIKSMDQICEIIAIKLQAFSTVPRESYPYFVSKIAFFYAYQNDLQEYEEEFF